MELITIKTFDNSFETHLLKTKLESEGINCYIFDENIVSMNPLFNNVIGGIKLKVNSKSIEKAKEILIELDNSKTTNNNGDVVSCPKCNSEDYYSGYKSMKGTKGIISICISFLFLIFPIYFKTVNKCKSCGHEFK